MVSQPIITGPRAVLATVGAHHFRPDALDAWLRSRGADLANFETAECFLRHGGTAVNECVLIQARADPGLVLLGDRSAAPVIYIVGPHDSDAAIFLLKRGAADVITDRCAFPRLAEAIESAWDACAHRNAALADFVRCDLLLATLTPREREVLDQLLAGRLNKEIAGDLHICENTVKAHRKRIIAKSGARSLVELARWVERREIRRIGAFAAREMMDGRTAA